jgi:hypothetical protein
VDLAMVRILSCDYSISLIYLLGNYDDENCSYIAVQHDHIAYRMS